MIDLNKEAVEYAKVIYNYDLADGYTPDLKSYETTFISGANSKYVQSEILKAQIEVLNKIGKKGSNPIDIVEEIFVLQQQLNQLENDNTTNTSS